LTRITAGPKYKVLATTGDNKLLRGVMNVNGWNQYHIIARGPVMLQILNGHLISGTIDEDVKNFVPEGLVGFQMHVGPPFKVEYRNILYRKL
ncbi:MAG TPA: family 16 glycoside hydrolase, partial [Bryobacteraceae bacterium]|nr:family 16 glycoside hydrolase [Bryobacteraceae bacterium]